VRFEWAEDKATANLEKHGIDFADVTEVFGPTLQVTRSDRGGEARWHGIGVLGSREIAVIFTVRNRAIRIISARRARKNERKAYRQWITGRTR
jgi:uncharacterized DUF497 family protein